jgi:ABC transporter DrrB family efflux protein
MTGPATSMATDLTEGVLDRFRSLPAKRSSYLAGHVLAELAGMGLSVTIMCATGLIIGWRPHEGLLRTLAGFGLIALFAVAMVWVGTLIGLLVRTPDAVMGVGFTLVFPMTFISNAFVPVKTLPGPLRAFAEWNPVSVVVAGTRQLFGNTAGQLGPAPSWPLAHAVPVAALSCLAIIAVTVPLCLARFRSRTTG